MRWQSSHRIHSRLAGNGGLVLRGELRLEREGRRPLNALAGPGRMALPLTDELEVDDRDRLGLPARRVRRSSDPLTPSEHLRSLFRIRPTVVMARRNPLRCLWGKDTA